MATPAGTNCWTQTEDWFATTLPKLTAFQSMCGVATEALATGRVFWDEVDEPAQDDPDSDRDLRSNRGVVACVSSNPERPYTRVLFDDGSWWGQGTVLIYIEIPVAEYKQYRELTESDNRGRIYREIKNDIGNVLDALTAYAYANGGPHIRDNYVAAFGENEEGDWQTEGRLIVAVVAIEWGMTEG